MWIDEAWDWFRRRVGSADPTMDHVRRLCELNPMADFAGVWRAAEWLRDTLARLGADASIIEVPTDGTAAFGGWFLPEPCGIEAASLDWLHADDTVERLTDAAREPMAVMMYTGATPAEGVEADLVIVDGEVDADAVAGRIVLCARPHPSLTEKLFDAGARGLVSDSVGRRPFIKDGPEQDTFYEWKNYALPPWRIDHRGFGLAVTPEQGRRIRAEIEQGRPVRLRARVTPAPVRPAIPAVTALIPGAGPEEVVYAGHFDEPGADDNGSGVAVGLTLVQLLLEARKAGDLPPTRRAIRLLFTNEVRTAQALLATTDLWRAFRFGVNADTVGSDQSAATCFCALGENFPALPSFTDDLLAALLRKLAAERPLFRWRRAGADIIDNIYGEPLTGAPMPQLYHFTKYHHTAADLPDTLCPRMLEDMTVLLGTYLLCLATAGTPEAQAAQALVEREGLARLAAAPERAVPGLLRRYRAKLASAAALAEPVRFFPFLPDVRAAEARFVGPDRLTPTADLARTARERFAALERALGLPPAPPRTAGLPPATTTADWVPAKAFRGFVCFEGVSAPWMDELTSLGVRPGWGAPMWLQHALFLADGKHSFEQIEALLREEGADVPADRLRRIFEVLAGQGLVHRVPVLRRADLSACFECLGARRGDMVMLHSSLSRHGFIDGGPDAVVDALLDVVGPGGTRVMPTFTWSWLGAEPFDPDASPSGTGAIPEAFRRRPGTVRSHHPTHAVAACGPRAKWLVAGHDWRMPPLDRAGPFGKLYDADALILMLSHPKAATIIHCGDAWAGVPFFDSVARIRDARGTREVIVRALPWHNQFDRTLDSLRHSGRMRAHTLGRAEAVAFRARDAVDTQMRLVQTTPEILLREGCTCAYCARVREWLADRPR